MFDNALIGKPMLMYLKETTSALNKSSNRNSGSEGDVEDEEEQKNEGDPRVIFTKRYAVDKDAPASQYSYARTSVKYTEEILRKHNQWMIRYYCTHRCLCF